MEPRCYPFRAAPLPYSFDALEPQLCEEIVRTHYEKHYKIYVERLNSALRAYPNYWNVELKRLLLCPELIPSDVRCDVMQNGGGVLNHELYFAGMCPCRREPSRAVLKKIESSFFSLEKWYEEIIQCGKSVFGSGYAALAVNKSGRLQNIIIKNQDTDYLHDFYPLLLVDVWEHSYYLQYKSDRAAYLAAWTKLIDWDFVGRRLEQHKHVR